MLKNLSAARSLLTHLQPRLYTSSEMDPYVELRKEYANWRREHPEIRTQLDVWVEKASKPTAASATAATALSQDQIKDLSGRYTYLRKQKGTRWDKSPADKPSQAGTLTAPTSSPRLDATTSSSQALVLYQPDKMTASTSTGATPLPCRRSLDPTTNAIERSPPSSPGSAVDIRTWDLSTRTLLNRGQSIAVIAGGDWPTRTVLEDVPSKALAAMSSVAAAQISASPHPPGAVIFTNVGSKGVYNMLYFMNAVVTMERPPKEPRIVQPSMFGELYGMLDLYHAGLAMGMEQYMRALRARLCWQIPKRRLKDDGIQKFECIKTLRKLPRNDAVFRCAVGVLIHLRREGRFKDKVFLERDLRKLFPDIYEGMERDDIRKMHKAGRNNKKLARVGDWVTGVEEATEAATWEGKSLLHL